MDPRQQAVAPERSVASETDRATPGIGRRALRVGARGRLESELRAIALDLLGPFPSDELPADVAMWIDAAAESAVTSVCDASLSRLIEALDTRRATAPPIVLRRLDDAAARHDAGII
ncbi:MAG TPA: hypothetical protein VGK63_12665 [Candidatus Limnocylindrales bacterium]